MTFCVNYFKTTVAVSVLYKNTHLLIGFSPSWPKIKYLLNSIMKVKLKKFFNTQKQLCAASNKQYMYNLPQFPF